MNSPGCAASSSGIDFQTALARLLRDGALRDLFARDRPAALAALGVQREDEAVIEQLDADDMECQARVLLRKRFGALRGLVPITLRRLDERAWPMFAAFARTRWEPTAAHDAVAFCRHLAETSAGEIFARELNRAEFIASERWFAIRVLSRECALQVLVRFSSHTREWCVRPFAGMPRA
jgi:hypothetical protein